MAFIPADVFVDADYVESLAQRIVDDLGIALGADQQRGRYQSRRIEAACAGCQRLDELRARRIVGSLIGHGPENDGGVIARGVDLFV